MQIRDASAARYEVPVPLNLPAAEDVGTTPLYSVEVAAAGEPFTLSVSRASTGAALWVNLLMPNLNISEILQKKYSRYIVISWIIFNDLDYRRPNLSLTRVWNRLLYSILTKFHFSFRFSSLGALTYENQFIQFTTTLASSYLYGFGENTHQKLRHTFEPRNTWPIFARDQPVGTVSPSDES